MTGTRWNTHDAPDGDTTYVLLGDRLDARLGGLRSGFYRSLSGVLVDDYRAGCLFMTVVDDTTDERSLGMATALEFVHQYVALRRGLFAGTIEATTTDLLLAGDVLLAEAFETVEEYAGPDDDQRYRELVETTLDATTASASDNRNPMVDLYAAAARLGGSVAGYDDATRETLKQVGHGIGRRVVGRTPDVPVTDRIDSLHQPLRDHLDRFVAAFVPGGER